MAASFRAITRRSPLRVWRAKRIGENRRPERRSQHADRQLLRREGAADVVGEQEEDRAD